MLQGWSFAYTSVDGSPCNESQESPLLFHYIYFAMYGGCTFLKYATYNCNFILIAYYVYMIHYL